MTQVKKDNKNLSMCACGTCPSYNVCTKKAHEGLFCSYEVGKSSCPIKMNGCVCGNCPIHKSFHLKSGYYCMNGSAEKVDKATK